MKVKACEAVKKSKKLLKFTLDDGTGTDRVILRGIHEYYEPEELVGKTCIAITNLPPRPMMGIDSCGMLISAVHYENDEERLHLLMVDPHTLPAQSCIKIVFPQKGNGFHCRKNEIPGIYTKLTPIGEKPVVR